MVKYLCGISKDHIIMPSKKLVTLQKIREILRGQKSARLTFIIDDHNLRAQDYLKYLKLN